MLSRTLYCETGMLINLVFSESRSAGVVMPIIMNMRIISACSKESIHATGIQNSMNEMKTLRLVE